MSTGCSPGDNLVLDGRHCESYDLRFWCSGREHVNFGNCPVERSAEQDHVGRYDAEGVQRLLNLSSSAKYRHPVVPLKDFREPFAIETDFCHD